MDLRYTISNMIQTRPLHSWNISRKEALRVQQALRRRVILKNRFNGIKTVAGCDMAIDVRGERGVGGIVVHAFPSLKEIERKWAAKKITFPYVPGLLSFREAPVMLEVFSMLKTEPDLIIFDGQGVAHPRGIGIAAHMGLWLDKPAIGCAKSRLWGTFKEPGLEAGASSELHDARGRQLGTVLRTKKNTRPVFVSPGHLIDFDSSVCMIEQCLDGYRIPKPTREADRFVSRMKKEIGG